jgi:hypothetical protein
MYGVHGANLRRTKTYHVALRILFDVGESTSPRLEHDFVLGVSAQFRVSPPISRRQVDPLCGGVVDLRAENSRVSSGEAARLRVRRNDQDLVSVGSGLKQPTTQPICCEVTKRTLDRPGAFRNLPKWIFGR